MSVWASGQPITVARWPDRRHLLDGTTPMVRTTMRQILLSSMAVGRPVLNLLLQHPEFAVSELRVRVESLRAGLALRRLPSGAQVAAISSWLAQAADPTERGAFGYRIGMAMADWATVQMLGVASTRHVSGLPSHDPRRARLGQPDLYGKHEWAGPKQWVIEAKGGTRVTASRRYEGAAQVNTGWSSPHVQALISSAVDPLLHVVVELGLPVSGRAPAGVQDVDHWPLRSGERHGPGPLDAFLRGVLLATVLRSENADVVWLRGHPTRVVALTDLDVSVGMREAVFEQVAAVIEELREALMPLGIAQREPPHLLVEAALSVARRALPSAAHDVAPTGRTDLFEMDDPVRLAAASPDGLIVLLGPSWVPENRYSPVQER
ncbi:hypothetical protein ATM99_04390 [Cellulomonas sp. B6]|nr:hypothetical protein ATM99_04390 [Cellulomonas sp. B6]